MYPWWWCEVCLCGMGGVVCRLGLSKAEWVEFLVPVSGALRGFLRSEQGYPCSTCLVSGAVQGRRKWVGKLSLRSGPWGSCPTCLVCVGVLCRRGGGIGKLRPQLWTLGLAFSLFRSPTPLGLPLQLYVEGDLKMQSREGLG